ncbi:MAG: DUF429 domain-containing protein, partial [Actinomycetes bacterium]
GLLHRHQLLEDVGLLPYDDPDGVAARAGVAADDVLDAIAAAWTAARVARQAALSFPSGGAGAGGRHASDDDSDAVIWA